MKENDDRSNNDINEDYGDIENAEKTMIFTKMEAMKRTRPRERKPSECLCVCVCGGGVIL